jgi:transcriptional regulator with XRE-family HTH domain
VVTPILTSKRWTRGKWAAKAGVSKNSVYGYLTGKRNLSFENRRALAEVLGLTPEELPD